MIDVCAGCGFEQGLECDGLRWVGTDGLLTLYLSTDFREKSERRLYSRHTLSDEEDGEDGERERERRLMLISGDVVNVERVTCTATLCFFHCLEKDISSGLPIDSRSALQLSPERTWGDTAAFVCQRFARFRFAFKISGG